MEISQILQSCRSKKAEDDFNKKFDFQDIIFPVKIGGIHKIEKKKNSIDISLFGYGNNEKHPIYVSKTICEERHVDFL